MNDNYTISYSYSTGGAAPQPTQPASEPPLFAFSPCETLDLPNGAVLLVGARQKKQMIVTRDVSIALSYCTSFRTLAAHAKYLTELMPELGGDMQGVQQVLEAIKQAGIFVSQSDYSALFPTETTPSEQPAASCVFIITCDRPAAVARLLDSMREGVDLCVHERLYLIDDSRSNESAQQNRELVGRFNNENTAHLHYFGQAERDNLIAQIGSLVPQSQEALGFLLERSQWEGQKTYGLARTLCLLLSVGKRAIVLDDDILCSALRAPFNSNGVTFKDGMCEAQFYPDAASWQQEATPHTQDPLKAHLHCLGLPVPQAVDLLQGKTINEGTHVEVLNRLTADSKVLITQCGTFGDPGTGDTSWCFSLTGDSLERLLASPRTVLEKISTRQYWLGRSCPTFSSRAMMSQLTGLDNTAILPPYFPAWRGEDLVFGAITQFLYPDSVVLSYDWAIPHLPLDERQGGLDWDPEMGDLSLLEEYLSANAPSDPTVSFTTQLNALVSLFNSLCESSDEHLAKLYRSGLAQDRANSVRELDQLQRQLNNDSSQWNDILESRKRKALEALAGDSIAIKIGGTTQNLSEQEIWQHVRRLVKSYADALIAWPAIRNAAAEIAAKNATPS